MEINNSWNQKMTDPTYWCLGWLQHAHGRGEAEDQSLQKAACAKFLLLDGNNQLNFHFVSLSTFVIMISTSLSYFFYCQLTKILSQVGDGQEEEGPCSTVDSLFPSSFFVLVLISFYRIIII